MTHAEPIHDDRWVLLAGGSGSVGSATARRLAEDGWNVALTYMRGAERAEAAASVVRESGAKAEIHQLDVADAAATSELVEHVAGLGMRGVVYAAGPHIPMVYVSSMTSEQFRSQMIQDALGCFNLLQPAISHLRKAGGGAIVAATTPALRRYASRDLLSAGPKGAVEQIVKAIASEEGKFGIRANTLGVGLLEDGIAGALVASGEFDETYLNRAHANISLRRMGKSAEVADGIAFLMSERASYITGQSLFVDGGYAV